MRFYLTRLAEGYDWNLQARLAWETIKECFPHTLDCTDEEPIHVGKCLRCTLLARGTVDTVLSITIHPESES